MTTTLVATQSGLFDVGPKEPIAFEGRDVSALSADAGWAIVDRRELWRRDGSWELAATSPELDLQCLLVTGPEIYIGTSEARLLRLASGELEVVDGFDEVEGREEWFTPWGGPPDVRSLTVGGDGDLYVNVHVGGIVKRDAHGSWEPTIDISADVHEVRFSGDLLVAACAIGLAESGDGGYAWNYDDEGLHARYARAIAVGDDFLFMTVARGPGGGDATVYRQPCDGSTPFQRCDLPSFKDNIDTGCLDARGSEVVFGTREGEVYGSIDHGETWTPQASGLPPIQHVALIK